MRWPTEQASKQTGPATCLNNDYTDLAVTALMAETEREILNDALGVDDPEESMPSDLIADQSQLEGWDGRPLTDDELGPYDCLRP